jgi:hypothetical protein
VEVFCPTLDRMLINLFNYFLFCFLNVWPLLSSASSSFLLLLLLLSFNFFASKNFPSLLFVLLVFEVHYI